MQVEEQSHEKKQKAGKQKVKLVPRPIHVIILNVGSAIANSSLACSFLWISSPYWIIPMAVGMIGALIGAIGEIIEIFALIKKKQSLHQLAYNFGHVSLCWIPITAIISLLALILHLTKGKRWVTLCDIVLMEFNSLGLAAWNPIYQEFLD